MNLVYVDEHYGKIGGKAYTAISGVIIEDQHFLAAREAFFEVYRNILNPDEPRSGVGVLPALHGSDLLRDYDDATKLAAVRALFEKFAESGAKVFRLGYFDKSLPPGILSESKEQRVSFCISNLLLLLKPTFRSSYIIAHELDKEGIRRFFRFQSDSLSLYYQLDRDGVSIDFEKFVGHYVALGEDIGCQVADIAGYVAMKAANPNSPFTIALHKIYKDFESIYFFNEVIWMQRAMKRE